MMASAADSEVRTLLHFVHLASSDIKAALDRSAPCRRSVDHRKYLQKQLRRFSQRCPRPPRSLPGPQPTRERRPPEDGTELPPGHTSILASSSDGQRACKASEPSEEQQATSEAPARPDRVPMRKRQLPASFWEEPRPAAGGASLPTPQDQLLHEVKRGKPGPDGSPESPLAGPEEAPSTWSCCPFQCHGPQAYTPPLTALQPPFPGLGLWRKSHMEGEAFCKPGDSGVAAEPKLHRPRVWKPIPTKPPVFSVFGYI